MPFYNLLRFKVRSNAERNRAVNNLIALREQLDRDIPPKDVENRMLLATWNIRDFSKTNRRGFGKRLPESFFYIAEVISRFDFVAVQEVNELDEWELVMDILGSDWDYIATDVTDRKLGGNGERLTYVYDTRKVRFKHIAGEIVLPADMLISKIDVVNPNDDEDKLMAGKQFRRSPFLASFQSQWFKFDICTVHIYYGTSSGAKLQERIDEIQRAAAYFGSRADEALKDNKALILLGDFNVVHPEHKTMQVLLNEGFVVPESLLNPTNIDKTKYYDQIAFKTKPAVIEFIEAAGENHPNAGVFEIFERILTDSDEDFAAYKEAVLKTKNGKRKDEAALKDYYKVWRTYQFSDHKPMWVCLNTNDSAAYLEKLKTD